MNFLFNLLSIVFSLFSIVLVIPLLQLIFNLVPDVTTEPHVGLSAKALLEYIKYLLSHEKHVHGAEAALIDVCVTIAVVFFFKNLFRYLALRVLSPIRTGVMRNIRNDIFRKLLTLPLSYYSNERKGDLMSRMTDDVRGIEQGIFSILEDTIIQPITIVLFLVWMLLLNASLTLFALGMLGVVALIIGGLSRTLKRQSMNIQETLGRAMSIAEESITGLKIIQGFGAEGYKTRKFAEVNDTLYDQGNRINRKFELSSPLTEFLAVCVFSVVLWFGGRIVVAGHMPAENFIQLILTFTMLIQPAKSFSTSYNKINVGLASSHRIFEILDAQNTIVEAADAKPIAGFKEAIEYKNVTFYYKANKERHILKGINLRIEKGKIIALVGQSGAGKTTLADLLPRFYDVTDGEILVDGMDIRSAKVADLRKLFGIVSQEPILFNDTVRNNIIFGKEDISQAQVEEAARVANAHDFISRLPQGYDTVIGDRGGRLSGGERQRLTIARAVLKDPPVLILDEATSSLDSESEKLVQDALSKLMKGRTTVVIAHRLSTIQNASEIIVMSEGRITERGTHNSLIAGGGMYAKLVELQAFE